MDPGRGILGLMEPLRFGKTEYELIWSRLDPFQPQLINLVKLIFMFFSFLAHVGPLGPSGWANPGQDWLWAGRWELQSLFLNNPPSLFALLEHTTESTGSNGSTGSAEVLSRTGARSPPSTRAGGQDDGSYTNSLKKVC